MRTRLATAGLAGLLIFAPASAAVANTGLPATTAVQAAVAGSDDDGDNGLWGLAGLLGLLGLAGLKRRDHDRRPTDTTRPH